MTGRRPPPTDATLKQALALPGGREPTAAHPDCRCGKPIVLPAQPVANWDDYDWDVEVARLRQWRAACDQLRACPVHRGGRTWDRTTGGAS